MEILYYTELDYSKVKKQFTRVVEQLKQGHFAAAEIKKMANTGYYRAKLDDTNRLLFKFARYEGKTYLLLLEVILNHDYRNSRFLGGADIEDGKIIQIEKPEQVAPEDVQTMVYINKRASNFHLLDKYISFDEDQQEVYTLPTPLIIIGSAGSGKTALTLEKIKTLRGKVLYITLSSFLVENSVNLYYSYGYNNEHQETEFLSFKEYIETLQIPTGKEINFRIFEGWFQRYRNTVKVRDAYKVYEEFKGVLTGMNIDKPYLSLEDYLGLGVRQSVFLQEERTPIYQLFEKYLQFLNEGNYYDLNLVAYENLHYCQPIYDFVIVDEVQDLTNVQLFCILKSLKKPGAFILCGDSNQIVHPNFFSWANVKTMFYTHDQESNDIRILRTNYRNSPEVTQTANKLLKVKNTRFGSIDRESTYLVNAISSKPGEVICLPDNPKIKQELNQKTRQSTQFAVVVMTNEDKVEARKIFQTPLLFSIHEAKGLEYENIILVNFVSNKAKEFIEIANGVTQDDINNEDIRYARAKDKTDKSLDTYKFYINSLYVAMTRAVRNLYIIETSQKHPLLQLLNLVETRQQLNMQEQKSSDDEWSREARRLEMQGKNEQADLIKQNILHTQKTPWMPITFEEVERLKTEAFNPDVFNKKAKDRLFDFALLYHDNDIIEKLVQFKYRRAEQPDIERRSLFRRSYAAYMGDDIKKVGENIKKYGMNYRDEFDLTPLLAALKANAFKVLDHLLEAKADTTATDYFGLNIFQLALQQAALKPDFVKKYLLSRYKKLQPETLRLKINNQLVKLNMRQTTFFLVQHFIAYQPIWVSNKKASEDMGFTMDDVLDICEQYPYDILPQYRQQRSYVNSILAGNEVERTAANNKKLFMRIARGVYVLNPDISVDANGRWIPIYDMMNMQFVSAEENLIRKKIYIEAIKIKAAEDLQKERQRKEEERRIQWQRRYWGIE